MALQCVYCCLWGSCSRRGRFCSQALLERPNGGEIACLCEPFYKAATLAQTMYAAEVCTAVGDLARGLGEDIMSSFALIITVRCSFWRKHCKLIWDGDWGTFCSSFVMPQSEDGIGKKVQLAWQEMRVWALAMLQEIHSVVKTVELMIKVYNFWNA